MGYTKKINFLFLLFFCSFLFINAQEVKWHEDLNKAIILSKEEKKPLMLFFTGSDWCGWCVKLKRAVLDTPLFAEWAKKYVVLVELDYPRKKKLPQNIIEQNNQLKQIFSIRGYPTVFFCDPIIESNEIKDWNVLGNCGYNPAGNGTQAWINHVEQFLN